MNKKIKTKLHTYVIHKNRMDSNELWYEIKDRLTSLGYKCFDAFGPVKILSIGRCFEGSGHSFKTFDIEIDTSFVSDCQQWNTSDTSPNFQSFRVHNWRVEHGPGLTSHRGYWIDITDEMKEILQSTFHCGFCSYSTTNIGNGFCPSCLGSEYLVQDNYPLLRLKPYSDERDYSPLTEKELEIVVPLIKEEQQKRGEILFNKLISENDREMENILEGNLEKVHGLNIIHKFGLMHLITSVFYYRPGRSFTITVKDEDDIFAVKEKLSSVKFPCKFDVKHR